MTTAGTQRPERPAQPLETASWGRRILALVVDWAASTAVVLLVVGPADYYRSGDPVPGTWTLGVFLLESAVFTAVLGGSFGKLATRLRVARTDGRPGPPDLLHALVRQVLVCLVVPPVIYRPDGRGLHDIAAGTATTRLQ